ncbi:MAG: hypothetical protein LBD41_03340 [Clostridiales Family XIII bacterium]|jgi:hypothetical protein|nr:hypothetical protein [Clostridiales Family XIII bacterium]
MSTKLTGYVSTDVVAARWNVSVRQVQALCKSGMVRGVVKFGNSWAIPKGTRKPTITRNPPVIEEIKPKKKNNRSEPMKKSKRSEPKKKIKRSVRKRR